MWTWSWFWAVTAAPPERFPLTSASRQWNTRASQRGTSRPRSQSRSCCRGKVVGFSFFFENLDLKLRSDNHELTFAWFFFWFVLDLLVPIKVPFSVYHKYMIQRRTMSISAVITDLQNKDNVYLATDRVVLINPPLSITVSTEKSLLFKSELFPTY